MTDMLKDLRGASMQLGSGRLMIGPNERARSQYPVSSPMDAARQPR